MIRPDKSIKCRCCGKDSGYTEKVIMHMVLPEEGLKCQHCGAVVIAKRRVEWAVGRP